MNEKILCKDCEKYFSCVNTGGKASNGSYIRYYKNGVKVCNLRCYACHRAHMAKTWEKRKPSAVAYEKTFKGCLMRKYRNMKSRVEGIQKKKAHIYKGKSILSKEEFYKWAENDPMYAILWEQWKNSGYQRKLSPSVDRIDSTKGYVLGNMQWVTHSENSRRGTLSKNAKHLEK